MAIVAIFELPGMSQAAYEQTCEMLNPGRGVLKSRSDWPVPGLLTHTAAPSSDGWFVADVWESEEAFQRFGDVITPILKEVGAPAIQPKVYPVFNLVTT